MQCISYQNKGTKYLNAHAQSKLDRDCNVAKNQKYLGVHLKPVLIFCSIMYNKK